MNLSLPQKIAYLLSQTKLTLAVAESATGGLLSVYLTNIPGISAWFKGGAICYSNELKIALAQVPEKYIKKYSSVSPQVAESMAEGIMKVARTDLGLGITGIAGPGRGMGLVYISLVSNEQKFTREFRFRGNRWKIREFAARGGLQILHWYLSKIDGKM